jgi:trans-2-enoyl-CoA reductase
MQRLVFHKAGPPADVLALESHILPDPSPGEVQVRILASPINPADLNFIEGTYGIKPVFPAVPGTEGCAEVTLSNAPDFSPGDRVIFLRQAEAWQDARNLPASQLLKVPAGLDPLQAAMLRVNPATAWRLLTGFGQPPAGSWVVQNAANSGVGRCVIQVARELGIRTVNFIRRPELAAELKELGADEVLPDDDAGFAVAKALAVSPSLAFNSVGGESALRVANLLARGGTHITFGAMAKRPLTIPNGLLIFKDISFRGLWVTRWIESAPRPEIDAAYGQLSAWALEGKLRQPVETVHSLAEYPVALARAAESGRAGKVMFGPGL